MSSDTGQEAPSASPNGTTATDTTLAVDKSKRDDDEAPLPPYPPNLRPLLFHFVRQMRDVLGFSERAHKTGDVVRTRLLGRGDDFHLAHPNHLKRVLLTEREKFRKSDDFRVAFGEGLLTVEGEKWQRQRNALQPLFARNSVIGYADEMVEQIHRRSQQWEDGDTLDLQREFTNMTLDVLFATI